MAFTLSSKSFSNGEAIPAKHTADGENASPGAILERCARKHRRLRPDHGRS